MSNGDISTALEIIEKNISDNAQLKRIKKFLKKNNNCSKLSFALESGIKKHEAEINLHKNIAEYYKELLISLEKALPEFFEK